MAGERPWEKYLQPQAGSAAPAGAVATAPKPWEKYTQPATTQPAAAKPDLVEFLQQESPWQRAFRERLESATKRTLTFGLVPGAPEPPKGGAEWAGEVAGTIVGSLPVVGGLARLTAPIATAVGGIGTLGKAAPVVGRMAQWGTAGAIAAAPQQVREVVTEEKPVSEAAKAIGSQAAMWAGLEAVGLVLSPLVGRLARPAKHPVPTPTAAQPKPMLALPPGPAYEAGTRMRIAPRQYRLETGEERLSRIIEVIRPEVERQRQQAVRIRQLLSESGAPPVESKRAAVDFLARAIPEVPKSAWRSASVAQLREMVEGIASGARVLPGGLEPIAQRVARGAGYDLQREFQIASLPARERLRALAEQNHWAQILGLRERPTLREPPRVPEAYVRRIEPEVGTAQLTTPGVQRIAEPGTPEWNAAVQAAATPENQVKAAAEAMKAARQVAKEAASPTTAPKAVAASYQRPGDTREFLSRVLSSVEGWLAGKGEPGQQIIRMAREVERLSDQQVTRWTREMLSKVARLSREERVYLREAIRAGATPKNPRVAEAAEAVRAYYAERPKRITQAGLTLRTKTGENIPFQPQENHFPLRLDWDWRKLEQHGVIREDALRKLVESGQAKNIQEAEQLLRVLQRRPYERHATFQYEAERIRLPEYEVDPLLALRSDLAEGETRIAQAMVYGPNDERLLAAVEAMHPGDQRFALKIANRLRGIDAHGEVERHVIEGLLTYNVLSKLGLAAIPNATQTVNTALKLGVNQLVRGIRAAVANKQEAIQFAQRAGIHLDPVNVARAIAEARGEFWPVVTSKFMRATGFATTEFWNRLITSQAAKGWAEDMFQALKQPGSVSWVRRVAGTQPERIRRLFAEAGVNVDEALRRGALSEDDLYRVVRWVLQRTQFPASQLDVPLWASSPWGRVLFQFKRYAFNQGRLLRRELWDETVRFFKTGGKEGSLRAWGPFLVLFPSAGWLVGAIRDWIAGKETPGEKVERIRETAEEEGAAKALLTEMIDAYGWVGGLGILTDTIQQLQYGPERTAVSLAGPTAGVVTDILSLAQQGVIAGQKIGAGESPEWAERARAAARIVARQVPIVGRPAARGELPFGIESKTLKALFAPEERRKLRSDWLPR